jgi:hypothetical protein
MSHINQMIETKTAKTRHMTTATKIGGGLFATKTASRVAQHKVAASAPA